MAKMFKVCCGVREVNGEYGYIIKRVRGELFAIDKNLFIYTKARTYHLVGIETGLELNHFYYYEDLENWYHENRLKYYGYRDSDYYREKVKRFKQLQEVAKWSL